MENAKELELEQDEILRSTLPPSKRSDESIQKIKWEDAARWNHCATYGYPVNDKENHRWIVYGPKGPEYGTYVEATVDAARAQLNIAG